MMFMDHAVLEITPNMQKFVDKLGFYYESYGIPRIGGKILGLIQMIKEPVSADQISKTLKVSRSSVSTNIRLLLSAGLVDISQKSHDRTDYFSLSDVAWENAIKIRIDGFHDLKKIVEQGIEAYEEVDEERNMKLLQMAKWTEMMMDMHLEILDKWRDQ